MKKLIVVIISIFCSGYFLEAGAQVFTNPIPPQINVPNMIWNNFRMGQLGNQMATDMARANAAAKKQNNGKNSARSSTVRPSNVSVSYPPQLSFARSAESPLAEKLLQAGSTKNSSLNAGQVNALLDKLWADYETSFKEENQRLKMPYNDVATAMTYFIEINYMTSRSLPSIKAESSAAIYRQLSAVLLQNPDFAKIGAPDKQLMAEVLVMMGGFPSVVFNQNRNFAQQRTLADENLTRIFGASAKNLQITEQGIEF